jgi:hypothetical protein
MSLLERFVIFVKIICEVKVRRNKTNVFIYICFILFAKEKNNNVSNNKV